MMGTLGVYVQPFFQWLLRSTLQASLVVCLIGHIPQSNSRAAEPYRFDLLQRQIAGGQLEGT